MISEDAKKKIDALTKSDLMLEINKKNLSRFQGEKQAYLQTRLSTIEQQERMEQRQEDVVHTNDELSLAREANKLSKIAIAVSILAALIALGVLIADVWSNAKAS